MIFPANAILPQREALDVSLPPVEKPQSHHDVEKRLAPGHRVVLAKKMPDGRLKQREAYRLTHFSIENSVARWVFEDAGGAWYEGTQAQPVKSLDKHLSVKLVMPILILHSRSGLKVRFSFRVDDGFELVYGPQFDEYLKKSAH